MKSLSILMAAVVLVFGTTASRAANVDRISAATGVPVATLQAERASTGLGWGSLEKAHLLANATGQSFDDVVALHRSGQGWGKIAKDNGLNLGRMVSDAHRSNQATLHPKNNRSIRGKSANTVHGRSATNRGKGHTTRMTGTRGVSRGSSVRSGSSGSRGMRSMGHTSGSHGMRSMGHMSGSRGMGSMGHGGGRGR
jgi:hypothetical protein